MCVHHVGFEVIPTQYFHFACLAKVILMVQSVNSHIVFRLELLPAQVTDLTRSHVVKVYVVFECSLFGCDPSTVRAAEVLLARMNQADMPPFLSRVVEGNVAVA